MNLLLATSLHHQQRFAEAVQIFMPALYSLTHDQLIEGDDLQSFLLYTMSLCALRRIDEGISAAGKGVGLYLLALETPASSLPRLALANMLCELLMVLYHTSFLRGTDEEALQCAQMGCKFTEPGSGIFCIFLFAHIEAAWVSGTNSLWDPYPSPSSPLVCLLSFSLPKPCLNRLID